MTRIRIGAVVLAGMGATSLLGQALPEPQRRPKEREPLYASVKVDPHLRSYESDAALSGTMRVRAQDVMVWLSRAWIAGFERLHPGVRLELDVDSLRDASAEFRTASLDFATAAVADDSFSIAVAGGAYRTMGFADTVAFFVNKDNPLERISLSQLDAIYSSTRIRGSRAQIKTWGQLGVTGEWADEPVIPWTVKGPQGFDPWLRSVILKGGTVREGVEARDTVFPLPYLVGFSRHSIGYAGLGQLGCASDVKPLAIAENDGGPYYEATFDEVLARKYPLSRAVHLSARRAPGLPVNPLLRELVRFILSREGQQIVVEDGIYLPLPAWFADRELAKLE
jgi:phosphate transport system substrate-binding protein